MFHYAIMRILQLLPTVIGVVSLTFLLLHITPGDPVQIMLGDYASPTDVENLRQSLGLHLPLWQQFFVYWGDILTGDWGTSYVYQRPVLALIAERLPATIQLASVAFMLVVVWGGFLGIVAALNFKRWPDKLAQYMNSLSLALPSFWLGPLLIIVFALQLGVVPVSGNEYPTAIILPAVTLATGLAAIMARMLRNSLLETLSCPYIVTARAKGAGFGRILKHAIANAITPVIVVLALQLGMLLTGTIITEVVFSWPGLGALFIEALHSRDIPLIQGCVLFIALIYTLSSLLADMLCAAINPAIRAAHSK